jgi:hypothetical protein
MNLDQEETFYVRGVKASVYNARKLFTVLYVAIQLSV